MSNKFLILIEQEIETALLVVVYCQRMAKSHGATFTSLHYSGFSIDGASQVLSGLSVDGVCSSDIVLRNSCERLIMQ